MGYVKQAAKPAAKGLDFRQVVHKSLDLICLHELDGTYIYLNPSIYRMTGWRPEDLIGKNPYQYFHPEDLERIRAESHVKVVAGDTQTMSEFRFRCADGQYIWLETLTQPLFREGEALPYQLYTTSRNISRRINLHNKLQTQQHVWEEASKMGRIGSWEVDVQTGKLHWSKMVFEIHGLDPTAGPVTNVDRAVSFFPGEARTIILEKIAACMERGIPYDVRLPFVNAQGDELYVRAIGKPRKQNGQIVKIYGVFQDVTSEFQLNRELETANRRLTIQRDQLMDFNHIIAHNLRAPIASLSVINQMIQDIETKEDLVQYQQMLSELAETMKITVDDLLDIVKIRHSEARELADVSFPLILEKVLRLLKPQITQQKAAIESDFSVLEQIHYSVPFLESIFLNLLSNALKYAHPDRKAIIKIRSYREQGKPCLLVSDNGIGIDLERNGHKVFKLYKTFHRHKRGKGFGLFLIKNQIEAMGGSIQVESVVNQGTTFKIVFTI